MNITLLAIHPLYQKQIRSIAGIQIELLNKRLGVSELSIQLSEEALDHIAEIGYDPIYGARPLKRAIQNRIENPLAEEMLKSAYSAGDKIVVEVNPTGEFVFSHAALNASV